MLPNIAEQIGFAVTSMRLIMDKHKIHMFAHSESQCGKKFAFWAQTVKLNRAARSFRFVSFRSRSVAIYVYKFRAREQMIKKGIADYSALHFILQSQFSKNLQ
jgi:hypothetical protein